MSVNVPAEDLSAATVGTQGTVSWAGLIQTGAPVGVRHGRPVLRLFNESGCGLAYTIGASSGRLPAGGWLDMQLSGENELAYKVEYVLPGQPVSLLLGTIYEAGEPIPPLPQLGNSPIGVGGSVSTSGAGGTDHILNTGNAPGTSTYSTTPSDQSGASFGDTNDGAGFRRVLSAGVLRYVWNIVRGNATTGKASVQIGDSGDPSILTLYGQVGTGSTVPASTITGSIPAASVSNPPWVNKAGDTMTSALTVARATAGGAANFFILDATDKNTYNVGIDGPTGDFFIYDATSGQFVLRVGQNGGVTTNGAALIGLSSGGSLSGVNPISGSGSATVNHGLSATPDAAVVNNAAGTNSSTLGSGSYTGSTVFIYQFSAMAWKGLVYKS